MHIEKYVFSLLGRDHEQLTALPFSQQSHAFNRLTQNTTYFPG